MRYLIPLSLSALLALVGCADTNESIDDLGDKMDANTAAITDLGPKLDALVPQAPEPPVVVDPESCVMPTGMTKVEVNALDRIKPAPGMPDADGFMAVNGCDLATSPTGYRTWLVGGLHLGVAEQDGLLIDKNGKPLTMQSLRGISTQKRVKIPDTDFTAACHEVVKGACDKIKVEAPTSTTTFTITVPKGTKAVVVGS